MLDGIFSLHQRIPRSSPSGKTRTAPSNQTKPWRKKIIVSKDSVDHGGHHSLRVLPSLPSCDLRLLSMPLLKLRDHALSKISGSSPTPSPPDEKQWEVHYKYCIEVPYVKVKKRQATKNNKTYKCFLLRD